MLRATTEQHRGDLATAIMDLVFFKVGIVIPKRGLAEEVRRMYEQSPGPDLQSRPDRFSGRTWRSASVDQRDPDATPMGKAIAHRMPISAIAGKAELMDGYATTGHNFFNGTFYGQVLNVAVANRNPNILKEDLQYERPEAIEARLQPGIGAAIEETGDVVTIRPLASLLAVYFTRKPTRSNCNKADFAQAENHPLQTDYKR